MFDDDFSAATATDETGTGLSSFLSSLSQGYAAYASGQSSLNTGNAAATQAQAAASTAAINAQNTKTILTYGLIAVGLVVLVYVFKKLF